MHWSAGAIRPTCGEPRSAGRRGRAASAPSWDRSSPDCWSEPVSRSRGASTCSPSSASSAPRRSRSRGRRLAGQADPAVSVARALAVLVGEEALELAGQLVPAGQVAVAPEQAVLLAGRGERVELLLQRRDDGGVLGGAGDLLVDLGAVALGCLAQRLDG